MWSWPIRVSRWKCDESIPSARGKDMNTPFHLVRSNLFFSSLSRFANLTALSLSLVMTKALENPGVFKGIWIQSVFSSSLRKTLCCLCVVPVLIRLLGSKQGKHKWLLGYECNWSSNCSTSLKGFMERVPSACRRLIRGVIFRTRFPWIKILK